MALLSEKIITYYPPFNKLSRFQRKRLLQAAQLVEFNDGQIIYRQGDLPDYFYFVVKGGVRILSDTGKGEKVIEFLKKGTPFGIISLLTNSRHSVTAQAIEQSYILRIQCEDFKRFLRKNSELMFYFLTILSQRVRKQSSSPKIIFQSLSIFCYAYSDYEKMLQYMISLSALLAGEQNKHVAVVEFSIDDQFVMSSFVSDSIGICEHDIDNFFESLEDTRIVYLCVKQSGNRIETARKILKRLTERFHFILFCVRYPLDMESLKEYVKYAHQFHVFLNPENGGMSSSSEVIDSMLVNANQLKEKFREFKENCDRYREGNDILKVPVYTKIPRDNDEYNNVLRAIYRKLTHKSFGLALGSGGAYGLSHIGVLQVLEQYHIPIDMICGTSFGGLIAALWALGWSIPEITLRLSSMAEKFKLFSLSGISFPLRGFLRAKKLEFLLKTLFADATFNDTRKPLRIVAFNFSQREEYVISEGYLYKAVAASCAMPGIFEPIVMKGEILVDGGIINPLPTKVLAEEGIHKIVAVNVTPHVEDIKKEYASKTMRLGLFDLIFGSIESMQRIFVANSVELADIVIHPNLRGLHWLEFKKITQFVERGKEKTVQLIPAIEKLLYT